MFRLKLEFEKSGVFMARLLIDEAPNTCRAIMRRLPFSCKFHHSIVSGEALVAILTNMDIGRENQRVIGINPGSLAFLVKDEPASVPEEIYIVYGTFLPRGLTIDMNQPVNIFARIDENIEVLSAVGRRVLMEGAELVRFSLSDGAGAKSL